LLEPMIHSITWDHHRLVLKCFANCITSGQIPFSTWMALLSSWFVFHLGPGYAQLVAFSWLSNINSSNQKFSPSSQVLQLLWKHAVRYNFVFAINYKKSFLHRHRWTPVQRWCNNSCGVSLWKRRASTMNLVMALHSETSGLLKGMDLLVSLKFLDYKFCLDCCCITCLNWSKCWT
jgi:hypothetical protein